MEVVIGRDISYKATNGSDPIWNWELGTGPCTSFLDFWNVMAMPNGDFKDVGTNLKIPTSKLPMSNSDLGKTHGIVQVTNGTDHSCTDNLGNAVEVEVFFEKDDINPHSNKPNWFHYWKQAPQITSLLASPVGINLFDVPSCSFNTSPTDIVLDIKYKSGYPGQLGGNLFTVPNSCQIAQGNNIYSCPVILPFGEAVVTGYKPNYTVIEIFSGASKEKYKDYCKPGGNVPNYGDEPKYEGIHAFYAIVAHEVEHAIIKCEVWNFTHDSKPSVKEGYHSMYDMDKDNYKDLWEMKSADGILYMFDETDPGDKIQSEYTNCYCTKTCSKGTMYEENRCRNVEKALILSDIDQYDWSFDKLNKYQGKNWK